jgi:PAS domain S-box-containing protein
VTRGADDTAPLADDTPLLEESAEELYEHAPAGYLSTLPGGTIVKVNETLLSWTGHARDDLVGRKRLHDLLAPGARIYYETHYAPLLAMQGSIREIAVELVRADGGRLPVLLNSTLVRDETGEPRVVRTTVFDASDRRRYERELQRLRNDAESRARAALALAHVHDGVVLVTSDDRLGVVNPAAERLLGIVADDAVGRPMADVVPEWSDVAARAAAGAVVVPLARGGHEQWLALTGVDAGDGGIVWTLRDVTAEHTLEQLRGDVIAIVSHELRTPLTGVYGSATTLLSRYDDLGDDVRRELLRVLVEQTERLNRLVDQMLLASRLDGDQVVSEPEVSDAADLVAAAVASVAEGERSRISVSATQGLLVSAHAASARQVLLSLLDNALKYSDGNVRVEVARAGPRIRFLVVDDGPGVPPAERERIFEKFYRLDPDQRHGVAGAGLGLYIARELTQRLQGRIALLPVERGTQAALELPSLEDGGSPSADQVSRAG